MRRILSIMLAAVLLFTALQGMVLADDSDTVLIFHTNDTHAYVEAEYDEEGNLTKLGMEYVAALHKAHPDSLLVDAGDFSQGGLFGGLSHGLSCYEVMNAAGYDIATLGNHEFDWGVAEFEENIQIAEFEVISANVTASEEFRDVSPFLYGIRPYTVRVVNGHPIAFLGIDTPELSGVVSPAKLRAGGVITRTDITKVAEEVVAQIREEHPEVQAIIAMTHCGYAEDSDAENSYDIAQVDGIDAVIDAHDHMTRLGPTAEDVGGTLVVSAGTAVEHIGELELTFEGDRLAGIRSLDASEEAAGLEPDAQTKAVIDSWNAKFDEIRNQVCFTSDVNLWGGNLTGYDASGEQITASIARRGYTNAGALMTDSIRWQAEKWLEGNHADYGLPEDIPVVAFLGGGSVRGSAVAGEITLGELMSIYSFSFENAQDSYILVTPKVLYDLIEHGVNFFIEQDPQTGFLTVDGAKHGRMPHFSGLRYVYDITQPASHEYDQQTMTMPDFIGSRVVSVTLDDGTLLDRNDNETKILLATGAYQIGGGDGYWMEGLFNDAADYGGYQYIEFIETPEGNQGDHLIDYIREVYGGHITAEDYPVWGDRASRVNDPYTKDTFDSIVTVTKSGEDPIADTQFTVYVNGAAVERTTDDDGRFTLEGLRCGPNEIRIIGEGYDSGSIYLDNFCGLQNPVAKHSPGEILPGGTAEAPEDDGPEQETGPQDTAEKTSKLPLIIGIICAAAVICLCVYLFLRKKKEG